MRILLSFPASIIAAAVLAGCTTNPTVPAPDVAWQADASSCRRVFTPQDRDGTVLCGTEAEWAEFDRRVAMINAGVSCRQMPMSTGNQCMTQEQWKVYDRRVRNHSDALRMGEEARAGGAMLSDTPWSMDTTGMMQIPP